MRKLIEQTLVDPLANLAWRGMLRPQLRPPLPLRFVLLLAVLPLWPMVSLARQVVRRRLRAAGTPKELEILRDLAGRLLRRGDYHTAARFAQDVLAIAPDDPTAQRLLQQARAALARTRKGDPR